MPYEKKKLTPAQKKRAMKVGGRVVKAAKAAGAKAKYVPKKGNK